MLFTILLSLTQIFAEDIPRSTVTRNLLSSTSFTYPDQLHIFKVKVLNCKVYAYFRRRFWTRRFPKSSKVCRNIITDFKKSLTVIWMHSKINVDELDFIHLRLAFQRFFDKLEQYMMYYTSSLKLQSKIKIINSHKAFYIVFCFRTSLVPCAAIIRQ